MQTLKLTFAAIALAAAGASALAADDAKKPERGAMRAACKADIEKLCPNVQPGEGRIVRCLKEKESSVSDQCKTALKNARRERKS